LVHLGFNLLVTIVERVIGQSFPDYVQQNIFKPAGVKSTSYCDDFTLTRGLAHAYRKIGAGYIEALKTAWPITLICASAPPWAIYFSCGAPSKTKICSARNLPADDHGRGRGTAYVRAGPKAQYGFAMILNHEDGLNQEGLHQQDHRRIGQHGSLMGYSGSLYDFPEDNLTIVVLTNTEDQNAYAITRALGRAILGLPALPAPKREAEPMLADKPISADERKQLAGTFVLKLGQVGANCMIRLRSFAGRYRVFDESGRLMIQPLGEGPELCLKQDDGSFAMRSSGGAYFIRGAEWSRRHEKLDSPGFRWSASEWGWRSGDISRQLK